MDDEGGWEQKEKADEGLGDWAQMNDVSCAYTSCYKVSQRWP